MTDNGNVTKGYTPERIDNAYFYAYMVLFFPIVIGNSLILISLCRFRELRTPMGLLIGSLATSDLLIGLILIPTEMTMLLLNLFENEYLCLFSMGTSVALLGASVFNMLAISVERFVSVAHPLRHRTKKTKTIVQITIPVLWVSVIIMGYLPLMGLNKHAPGKVCMYKEVFLMEYIIAIGSCFALCIFINIGFFVAVIRIALSQLRKVKNSSMDNNFFRISRKLTRTYVLMAVSATFIICWGPLSVISVVGLFYRWDSFSSTVRWAFFAGFLNSGINWMIYGIRNPKFRRAIKASVMCKSSMAVYYISNSS